MRKSAISLLCCCLALAFVGCGGGEPKKGDVALTCPKCNLDFRIVTTCPYCRAEHSFVKGSGTTAVHCADCEEILHLTSKVRTHAGLSLNEPWGCPKTEVSLTSKWCRIK